VFYILHGDDEFSLGEKLAELRNSLAGDDPAMAELNTTILDGNRTTLGEIRHACDSIPFMAAHRLVIVRGLLGHLVSGRGGKGQKTSRDNVPSESVSSAKRALLKDLAAYLPALPASTHLIFVENQALKDAHPILKVAQTQGRQLATIEVRRLPRQESLSSWIQQRVAGKGGSFDRAASELLAALVGRDLRLLDQEIDKLLLYADGRQVTVEDVRALVSLARQADIFDLVDFVGRRETDLAMRVLHRMLEEGAEPLYLLAMLARQVRILIQVSELYPQQMSPHQIARRIKQHPFAVEKGLKQSRNFSPAQLAAAHQCLVETDWKIKTGQLEPVLALDMLVVSLTRI
jgi:DNA polymerase-3 subunit delta